MSAPTQARPRQEDPALPWKVARDPYLGAVAARWGEPAAFAAGFFLDDDPEDAPLDDVGWLCTPLDGVRRAIDAGDPAGRRPVVLLSTGGFFPIHAGHRLMMERARDVATAAGWWVVGGYLSPGHDQYLRLKWGPTVPPASARIGLLDEAIGDSDWLAVDPWEALARRVSVNYTDVTARLQAYLRHHLRPDVDVAFVCGSDNARFALAFALQGRCIVVDRPGWEDERDRWQADHRVVAAADRILWADGAHPGASSDLSPAPWAPAPHHLTVRIEDESVVRTLGLTAEQWRSFQQRLAAALRSRVELTTVVVADQRPVPVVGVLSLDPLLPGEADLAVSRCFDLGGYRQLGHVARPGAASIDAQVAAIGPGPWRLRDDDRSTGGTVAFVRELLAVTDVVVTLPDGRGEIADSRDFLLGTDDGGLVVRLPDGTLGRAPYLLPYVDPAARGTVPAEAAISFSAEVWEANADTFAGSGRTVAHLPVPAAAVLLAAGFTPDADLANVCRAHAAALHHLAPPAD